ncbi:MAG: BsuBI/PstI family type II restriction endonuclease [Raoultibacter sp.]
MNYAEGKLMPKKDKIEVAQRVLRDLGMDAECSNERSAMVLLALAGISPSSSWLDATNNRYGTRAIMDWIKDEYDVVYAANTRETIRRFTLHQFVEGGLVEENADDPARPINSPKWNYRINDLVLDAIKHADMTEEYAYCVTEFNNEVDAWKDHYTAERNLLKIPVTLPGGQEVKLSAGGQNKLIKSMVNDFCPRFAPGAEVLYIGDTDKITSSVDTATLSKLGVALPERGKAPDLIVWMKDLKWLFLMEACSTHGPIDVIRMEELKKLFAGYGGDIVYVSCFPTRKVMQRFLSDLAWETEAWCADSPDHMIHLDGEKFLGPFK